MNKYLKIIIAITICQLVGVTSSIATINSIPNWYEELNKPFFNPPNWIFGPVWTILYGLMGFSLYLMWGKLKKLKWFFIQLILNFFWTIFFFGFKETEIAYIIILGLILSIILTIKDFYKNNKLAAYLLIPYLFWVIFASFLNLSIILLN